MGITDFCRAPTAGGLALLLVLTMPSGQVAGATENAISHNASASSALAISIDSENLIDLYKTVPGLKIIDSRHREDHVLGHIESSHNLPSGETSCKSLLHIAGSLEQALVFYCNGLNQGASMAAIEAASSCGYKRLFWLRGGFVEWQDKDYPFVIE